MSGIGALVQFGAHDGVDRGQLEKLAQGLRLYGRDRQDVTVSENCGLIYAHCARTSIHDPLARAGTSGEGRFHLVFDGRLDARDELIRKLGVRGDSAQLSDARLAALSWQKWYADAPKHWAGEFAVIVWDSQKRILFCVRDQLGLRPLSWHRTVDGTLIVASAAKAMFAVDGVERTIDEQKIADQLLQLFHDSERGYFKDFRRVGFASVAEFSAQGSKSRKYWSVDELVVRDGKFNVDELAEQARELLRNAVSDCLRGSHSPAAFMSGGLDSSSVAVTALDVMPEGTNLPTFTWVPSVEWNGLAPRGTYGDERPYVDSLARMHPRLKPQYLASEGLGPLHLLEEFIDLAGVAPRNASNFCWLHDIRQHASGQGHDLLLEGAMGNATLSWNGSGVWREWLGQGRLWHVVRELARKAPNYAGILWLMYSYIFLPSIPRETARWFRRARRGFPKWPHWRFYSAINPQMFEKLDMQARLDRYG